MMYRYARRAGMLAAALLLAIAIVAALLRAG